MNVNLDRIQIAKPCSQSWAEMKGDDQVRHCAACELCVFNISEMTRAEAVALIQSRSTQRTCIRLHRRADGTVITRDCPTGTPKAVDKRRLLRNAVVASAAMLVAACSPDKGPATLEVMGTQSPIGCGPVDTVEPRNANQLEEMGDICEPIFDLPPATETEPEQPAQSEPHP